MRKCECGSENFTEYSKEQCAQKGVKIEADGNLNYDDADIIEILGLSETMYLECQECGKEFKL